MRSFSNAAARPSRCAGTAVWSCGALTSSATRTAPTGSRVARCASTERPAAMNAVRTTAEPYWDLVEESLEEAAFLWKRWEADLESLTRSLEEVWSWTEDRLQGALDGVRVAGGKVVEVTEAALCGKDPAAITAAAHALAAQTPARAREALATAVRNCNGKSLQAMTRGIETAALDGSFAPVTAVLASAGPEHSAALCRIKRFRRVSPGREMTDALQSGIAELQVEAL